MFVFTIIIMYKIERANKFRAKASIAKWLECWPSNPAAIGSSPGGDGHIYPVC